MKTDFDTIVLGLGGFGAGALYWLAQRLGGGVLGLEQFALGHASGGSQDHSRIIRLSYHTPAYVELAKAAYETWAELEADAGTRLIIKTGGLDLSPAGARIPIATYTGSLDAAGVPYEWLSAAEVMSRWPQFRLTDDVGAIYQPESGIAPAARCNAAHLSMARRYGAVIREEAPVSVIRDLGSAISVTAGGVEYRCRHLVIAAGAWTNNLLAHFGRRLPLTVTQEQVVYYDSSRPDEFLPDRFPIWIWMDEPCFYGFPIYGEPGPKVSQDVGGRQVTAETRSFDPDPALQARIDAFVKQVLPGAFGPPLLVKTCLYTLPPDRDFVLDTLPDHPNVSVAVGAAHGFKFASLVGRILAALAGGEAVRYDLSPFKVDRPILMEANPQTGFMI